MNTKEAAIAVTLFSLVFYYVYSVLSRSNAEPSENAKSSPAVGDKNQLVDLQNGVASDYIQVYFGAGCFWHMQHEFIIFERTILGREDPNKLTSVVGYAGGKPAKNNNKQPCYHNFFHVNDYNSLGHAEVVQLVVPKKSLYSLAKFYFKLLPLGDRIDTQDVGPEYRSLIGIPGGINGDFFPEIEKANLDSQNLELREGSGNDPDTLRKKLVYVMDSRLFKFYQGELYHQFHDDMIEKYSDEYHHLKKIFIQKGKIDKVDRCPDERIQDI